MHICEDSTLNMLNCVGLHISVFLRAIGLPSHSARQKSIMKGLVSAHWTNRLPHANGGLLRAAVRSGSVRTVHAVLANFLLVRFGADSGASEGRAKVRAALSRYINDPDTSAGSLSDPPAAAIAAAMGFYDILRLLVTGMVCQGENEILSVLPPNLAPVHALSSGSVNRVPGNLSRPITFTRSIGRYKDKDEGRVRSRSRGEESLTGESMVDLEALGEGGWSLTHCIMTGLPKSPLCIIPASGAQAVEDEGEDEGVAVPKAPVSVSVPLREVTYEWSLSPFAGGHNQPARKIMNEMLDLVLYTMTDSGRDMLLDHLFHHTVASTVPCVLDAAARAGMWAVVDAMLDAGALGCIEGNSSLRVQSCFAFAHEAVLQSRWSVFDRLLSYAKSSTDLTPLDADGAPAENYYDGLLRLRPTALVNRIMHSVRTHNPSPGAPLPGAPPAWVAALLPAPPAAFIHSLLHDAIIAGDEAFALNLAELTADIYMMAKADSATKSISSARVDLYKNVGLMNYAIYEGMEDLLGLLLRPPYSLNIHLSAQLPFPNSRGILLTPVHTALMRNRDGALALLLAADAGHPYTPGKDADIPHLPEVSAYLRDVIGSAQGAGRLITACISCRQDHLSYFLIRAWKEICKASGIEATRTVAEELVQQWSVAVKKNYIMLQRVSRELNIVIDENDLKDISRLSLSLTKEKDRDGEGYYSASENSDDDSFMDGVEHKDNGEDESERPSRSSKLVVLEDSKGSKRFIGFTENY